MTITLRNYQSRIVNKVMEAIGQGHRSILIEAPAGSGKTIMAHVIMQQLKQTMGWDKLIWTTMRKHLLTQAEEANKSKIGLDGVQYISMFEKNPPVGADVLVEDEGHHSAANSAIELFKKVNPKLVLALSCTPYRLDRLKLSFSIIIKDAGIRGLIDLGYLSPFHQYIFNKPWTPQNVADVYLRDIDRWGKTVIFFLTEAECNACAALISAGVKCEVVIGSSDQESQIHSFLEGDTQVLISCYVLAEGFDAPLLRTVFSRPGSRGPTVQMCGRSLRIHPSKQFAQVVQSSDSRWPFTKIASCQKKYALHNCAWHECGVNQRIDTAVASSLRVITKVNVSMPQYIKDKENEQA